MKNFHYYDRQDVLNHTNIRRFETKLGESIQTIADNKSPNSWMESTAKYVLFGIPEDIGVRANHGVGGAASAWQSFLKAFLNIQSNDFFSGEEVLLLGHFDFSEAGRLIEQNAHDFEEKIDAYRHAVKMIDDEVEELVKNITAQQKIPIAIGGGHNNAYPLIKGAAKGLHKSGLLPLAQINCINLDAHTDFRPSEGRHSGNGFRYAEEDGYMQKYCVLGLHENYLPQNVWFDFVNNPFLDFITYEDIFIREKRNFIQSVAHAAGFTEDNYTGIELDLDSIQHTLSSAVTPSGISALHARQYITFLAQHSNAAYLHICEGAANLADGRRQETMGKLISYLVTDFVKR
ncbi:MAG: formimidoylglutamase [Candidatus Pseudobacter hemicellulosilyticus]|uniref:Formimidoylglutamase n=1 Tax=Candidatus Pseudobacter hemicellulosilyticus TaxID=3121375 RepID=A0AAJ5WPE9_9BACT|nr:MAG: formimidoylglutamase [Pseudobacter sp.]